MMIAAFNPVFVDGRFCTPWRAGPAPGENGPFFVSCTEFTPTAARDLPAIYLAARQLRDVLTELPGAIGVSLYWRRSRRVGSLSAWESETALRSFVSSPQHLEVVRRYRGRGTLRTRSWWAEDFRPAAAFAEASRRLV